MITQEKPRITFVVSALYPTLGLETVTLRLLEILDVEFDIHVVCIGGSDADKMLHDQTEVLGSPLRGLQRLRSVRRLYAYSRRSELGTVVLVGVWSAVPWLLIAPKRAMGTVIWEHTLLKEKMAKSSQLRLLKGISRWLYRRADCAVGVSTPVTDDLAEYGNIRQLVTIPNLVNTPPAHEIQEALRARAADPYRIVCVGSLTTIKSQDLAIRALTHLDDQYSLTLIGAGPRMQELKDLAKELGVQDRVQFTGHLARNLVMEHLKSAALLLHCSVAETFGLVYVEAAALGVPVMSVSTRVSKQLIPAYVPGWLCENDAESIAKAIRGTQTLPQFRDESYLKAADRRAIDFGVTRVRDAWLNVFRAVDRSNSRPRSISASEASE